MIGDYCERIHRKDSSPLLNEPKTSLRITPIEFPFLKFKPKDRNNITRNLIKRQNEVFTRTSNLIHIGYDSETDLIEMSKKIKEEKAIIERNSVVPPPKLHIDSPYKTFQKKLKIRLSQVNVRPFNNKKLIKKSTSPQRIKIVKKKINLNIKRDSSLFLTNLFSPLSSSMTNMNFNSSHSTIQKEIHKSVSQKNFHIDFNKSKKIKFMASENLRRSESLSQELCNYLDKQEDYNYTERFISNKIVVDSSFVEDLSKVSKKKKDSHLGMKYINNGKNGKSYLIKQGMANLMNFGDFYYRLEDTIFYQNRKAIYKKYPALRKEAELVNVYAEEEEKAKKVEGAKKMHKNQRIIHGLMYRNQQLFNNIMGKSPRKKE